MDELNELLREQAAYYRAFADGYDKAYERRSDLGALDPVLDRLPVTGFFGFWLSHVPAQRLGDFWSLVAGALRPAGRVCFVDSGSGDMDGEEILDGQPAPAVHRRLTDGSPRRVVKVFRDPAELEHTLAELGWQARVWPIGPKLVVGYAAHAPTT